MWKCECVLLLFYGSLSSGPLSVHQPEIEKYCCGVSLSCAEITLKLLHKVINFHYKLALNWQMINCLLDLWLHCNWQASQFQWKALKDLYMWRGLKLELILELNWSCPIGHPKFQILKFSIVYWKARCWGNCSIWIVSSNISMASCFLVPELSDINGSSVVSSMTY